METRTIQVYDLEELKPEIQEKVIESFGEIEMENFDSGWLSELFAEHLSERGD